VGWVALLPRMGCTLRLDKSDRKIISMFAEDPRVSQDEIARELGISQPSVAGRIKRLRDAGGLEMQVGLNPEKMDLHIGKVDITSTNTQAILDMFRGCPYFMNGYNVSGKHNLCLFFIAENIATMEAIINGHIRPNEHVKEVEFNIVISAEKPLVVPTILTPTIQDQPPCGILIQCTGCPSFRAGKCMGCPAIGQYQGWLF